MSYNIFQQIIPHKTMRFAPVTEDNDELSQIIQSDPLTHDNLWDLKEPVNAEKLNEFWSDAVEDLSALDAKKADD